MGERTAGNDRSPWRGGYMLAFILGGLTVAVFYAGLFVAAGLPSRVPPWEIWPFVLLQVMLASLAFGLLARRGIQSKLPWLVAVGLTIGFWSVFLVGTIASTQNQTGANIGLGWLMLASPFLIAGLARLTDRLASRR